MKEGAASTVLTTTAGSALSWGTVTNAMLANSKVTIGTTDVDLGATVTTFAGLASVTSTSFTGALTGNADTATALETARNIGGVSFNGTAAIVPNTIAVNDTANSGCSVALFESATGSLAPKTDEGLTYAADTHILSATGFSGPLTGNATTATNLAGSSHTQNTVYAAPDGSAGTASFRALVSGDIPANAANTTGNADTATKITTITNSNIVQLGETQTLTNKTLTAPTLTTPALGIPASGNFSTGSFTWPTFNQATTANAGSATIANNIAGGLVGQLPYQSAVNTTALLTANLTATKKFLTGTGTGSAGQAPVWNVLESGDIPANAANTTGNADTATTATTATNIAGGVGTRIPFQSGTDTTTFSANLTFASGTNTLAATNFTGALTGNAATATKSTNITGGLVNQIPFQSAADTTTFDADLTYTAATDTLSATNFSGGGVTLDPAAAAGGALTISNTTTQTSAELVKITGVAGQTALDVAAGNTTFAGATSLAGLFHLTQISSPLSSAGGDVAIDITNTTTLLETDDNDYTFTLPDGAAGQLKILIWKTDGGAAGTPEITPDTAPPWGTTITLSNEGDTVTLLFIDGAWQLLSTHGGTVTP